MKPTLEAYGTKRLKLQFDVLLSIFAVKFHLRRYNVVAATMTFLVITLAVMIGLFVFGTRAVAVLRPVCHTLGITACFRWITHGRGGWSSKVGANTRSLFGST
jgi:hypothetical protein